MGGIFHSLVLQFMLLLLDILTEEFGISLIGDTVVKGMNDT